MQTQIFDTPEEVADQFAQHFLQLIGGEKTFHVALSGGSTPKILFDILAEKYRTAIDWSNVHFWWGDERCVPPSDDDSNYKMTTEHLLDHISIPEKNVHRIKGEKDPSTEAIAYSEQLAKSIPEQNGLPRFDLIVLGMGPDGHTASIFPHEMELLKEKQTCAVATHPESGQKRITLTGNTINNASEIAFLVTGANKLEKIAEIFKHKEGYKEYPAAHIQPKDGKLIWFMDKAAFGNN